MKGKIILNLKSRLLIAFFIIILLPIMLITAAGGAILSYQVNSIQQSYDVDSNTLQVISNPLQILNRVTRGVFNEIKLRALKNPVKLEDEDYINELNAQLGDKYSFIVVRKDGEIIYRGNEKKSLKIEESLPKFGVYNVEVDGGIYIGGDNPFLVKQQDFYYSDGAEGSIFVITDVNIMMPQLKSSIIQMVIAFIFILCLSASILIIWVYRGIIRPLNVLKIATNQIKEGNLNFSIKGDSDDEIGELCLDFEDMRIRLKELIESRIEYENDMKEMISNISHDLKTPLTAIKGYSEGIIDGVADTPEKLDKYVKTIYTKASAMTILVDELFFYSKLDGDSMPYIFKKINIHEYFTDCLDEYSLDAEASNVKIKYENELDTKIRVIADAEQLKRVVNNIINNAVKYIGKKEGQVTIRIVDALDFVQIEIEDTGEGIAPKDLPHIFDRFYRADASRNSKRGGTGLGLAIAKKVIEEHSGRIWATSVLGVGTTIYFTLKKCKEDENGEQNFNH